MGSQQISLRRFQVPANPYIELKHYVDTAFSGFTNGFQSVNLTSNPNGWTNASFAPVLLNKIVVGFPMDHRAGDRNVKFLRLVLQAWLSPGVGDNGNGELTRILIVEDLQTNGPSYVTAPASGASFNPQDLFTVATAGTSNVLATSLFNVSFAQRFKILYDSLYATAPSVISLAATTGVTSAYGTTAAVFEDKGIAHLDIKTLFAAEGQIPVFSFSEIQSGAIWLIAIGQNLALNTPPATLAQLTFAGNVRLEWEYVRSG